MTRKFWYKFADFAYQVTSIELDEYGTAGLLAATGWTNILEHKVPEHPDRILDATFSDDECSLCVLKWTTENGKIKKEIMQFYLQREHVKSVSFKFE